MAKATITIEDLGDSQVNILIDFGTGVELGSPAHRIAGSAMEHIQALHEGVEPAKFVPASQETRPHPVTGA